MHNDIGGLESFMVQFSGSFCAINWLNKQQKFKGLSFANSLIVKNLRSSSVLNSVPAVLKACAVLPR